MTGPPTTARGCGGTPPGRVCTEAKASPDWPGQAGGTPAVPVLPAPAPSLDDKLLFLRSRQAYPGLLRAPTWVETHMSWVFFAGDKVFKLKKPLRFPLRDFTTLAAREWNCLEELRLNRRLAPDVYLGLVALEHGAGGLVLVPREDRTAGGQTVDWLVVMRRLPSHDMLHARIAAGRVQPREIDALARVLARFFRDAARSPFSAQDYLNRFQRDQAANREVLLRPQFRIPGAGTALARHDAALARGADWLRQRVADGRIVDGHGDLRPEHVCMSTPPVVIDCLEFDASLRQVDPDGEIAFLALECDMAGAAWIGPRLLQHCHDAWGDAAPPRLMQLYTAHHALVRARLALAHLLDPQPRTPDKWPALAHAYVRRARRALHAIGAGG